MPRKPCRQLMTNGTVMSAQKGMLRRDIGMRKCAGILSVGSWLSMADGPLRSAKARLFILNTRCANFYDSSGTRPADIALLRGAALTCAGAWKPIPG